MNADDDRSLREAQLDAAMEEDVYRRAGQETGYWANYFLRDLRANGGLATAKKLLHAKGTSEGFKRLREERRLDLTVEALVLRHEFRPLFTTEELELAMARLDRYGFRSVSVEPMADDDVQPEVQAELDALLRAVTSSPPDRRMERRNDVVAFGPVATTSMHRWLRDEHLTGFAISALEHLNASDPLATRALEEYAVRGGRDRVLASAALDRLRGARAGRPANRSGDVYVASGTPEATFGPCEVLVDGRACSNNGRHPMSNGQTMCTTHRKAWERAHQSLAEEER
jgi:hypothetical protein